MSERDEDRRGDRPRLRGDEADLFREYNRRFVRTVQSRTNAPREIVDDACGFAWQQFMRHQPDRDRNWRSRLLTTAEREACGCGRSRRTICPSRSTAMESLPCGM